MNWSLLELSLGLLSPRWSRVPVGPAACPQDPLAQPLRAQARAQTFPAALRGGARAPPPPPPPAPGFLLAPDPPSRRPLPISSELPNAHLPICQSALPISASRPSSPRPPHLPARRPLTTRVSASSLRLPHAPHLPAPVPTSPCPHLLAPCPFPFRSLRVPASPLSSSFPHSSPPPRCPCGPAGPRLLP